MKSLISHLSEQTQYELCMLVDITERVCTEKIDLYGAMIRDLNN